MPQAQLASDGGLSDITSLLSLVKGSSTTSTTGTNISTAGVQQQINDILSSNQGLAAVAGAQKSAGLYNSSTNTQLTNDLLSRVSAQVAAKDATTTQTVKKNAALNGSQVKGLVATAALNKLIGGKGPIQNAKDLYDKVGDQLGFGPNSNSAVTDALSNAGPGDQLGSGDLASLEDSLGGGSDGVSGALASGGLDGGGIGLESPDALGPAVDINSTIPDALVSTADTGGDIADAATAGIGGGTGIIGAGGTGAIASEGGGAAGGIDASGTLDFGSSYDAAAAGGDALDSGIADEGATALGSSGSSALAATGWGALAAASVADVAGNKGDQNADIADVIGGLGTGDIVRGIDSGNVIDSVNPLGQVLLEVLGVPATGGWIVCTELLRQGRFNRKYYAAGLRKFQSYPKHLVCGYYIWATPSVSHLRKHPYSLYSRLLCWVFNQRGEYLAACAGVSGACDTIVGQSISAVVYGFCFVLGHTLNLLSRKQGATYGRI